MGKSSAAIFALEGDLLACGDVRHANIRHLFQCGRGALDSLTFDQIQALPCRRRSRKLFESREKLNRAQSAVTYGIQKLEAQVGLPLFDRTAYRSALTEAGSALLLRARRIAEETNAFRDAARSLASGLEAELTIVMDSMFPMPPVVEALRALTKQFPTVPPRVYVQSLGSAAERVLDGTCMIGLMQLVFTDMALLKRFPLLTVGLVPVAAPGHPLAMIDGPIDTHVLHDHVQLVLTDRLTLTAGRDYGVLSVHTWRLADLGAKHSMLLAGLGWGNMPLHLVEADIGFQ
ncbi:LysR family transcriptional regulator (plasmid) [Rhizobium ruizarguesonis]|uniref:LysR family transcriptional regulator n=1 Tax=Rhizobium ruizarguesonis TaxID=2081791 RepID=A0ACD5EV32_9HYPH